MKTLILGVFILTSALSFAQPIIEWQKTFGGSLYDYIYDMQETTDGGFILAGSTKSNDGDVTSNNGGWDFWIVKLTSTGTLDWQKNLGGTNDDFAYSIQQTSDGGYIVAGATGSTDGDVTSNQGIDDYWIVKLTSAGALEWQKTFGGSDSDEAHSIQQTSEGGYVVSGYTFSNDGDVTGNNGDYDFWVIKLTSTGTLDWQKTLGGTGYENAYSIQQTSDGGFIVAGASASSDGDVTGSNGNYDYWIVKLTSSGVIDWQKALGGTGVDAASSIQQTSDGGYIVAGSSDSFNGDVTPGNGYSDYWVVKLTNTGSIDWEKSFGGSGYDYLSSIQQTSDGGYIVTGSSPSNDGDVTGNHGDYDQWVVKLTNTGVLEWQKSLGGTLGDYGNSILQTSDGGYIVAGESSSNDGDITTNQGLGDCWVVKLLSSISGVNDMSGLTVANIYPNPSNSQITIETREKIEEITILNLNGVIVQQEKTTTFSVENLSNGVYIMNIKTSEGIIRIRFIKE